MTEIQTDCYPVCEACRVAGVCKTPALARPPLAEVALGTVGPARVKPASAYDPILLKCGHSVEGHGFTHLLGDISLIFCHYHGWVKRAPVKKKKKEKVTEVPGQESLPPF